MANPTRSKTKQEGDSEAAPPPAGEGRPARGPRVKVAQGGRTTPPVEKWPPRGGVVRRRAQNPAYGLLGRFIPNVAPPTAPVFDSCVPRGFFFVGGIEIP